MFGLDGRTAREDESRYDTPQASMAPMLDVTPNPLRHSFRISINGGRRKTSLFRMATLSGSSLRIEIISGTSCLPSHFVFAQPATTRFLTGRSLALAGHARPWTGASTTASWTAH